METAPETVRVLIVEDETMLSDFVEEALSEYPQCSLVGAYEDGLEAWSGIEAQQPNFVILDVNVPSLNGLELLSRLKQKYPATRVLLFSGYFTIATVRRALKTGVEGIIEKTAGLKEMHRALQAVLEGQSYFGPKIRNMLAEVMRNPDAGDALDVLSDRERLVLQLIAEGHSTKAIAEKLGISDKTASTHRANLMQKLDLHGVAELTRFAIANGLTSAGGPLSE